jgi:hypothetical protein
MQWFEHDPDVRQNCAEPHYGNNLETAVPQIVYHRASNGCGEIKPNVVLRLINLGTVQKQRYQTPKDQDGENVKDCLQNPNPQSLWRIRDPLIAAAQVTPIAHRNC